MHLSLALSVLYTYTQWIQKAVLDAMEKFVDAQKINAFHIFPYNANMFWHTEMQIYSIICHILLTTKLVILNEAMQSKN